MPDPTRLHLAPHCLRPGVLALAIVAAASCSHRPPPGGVTGDRAMVDGVPPDACVAFYGPGPCREHGRTVQGSTDAVALWRGPAR